MSVVADRPSLFDSPIDPAVAQRALAASAVAQGARSYEKAVAVGGRVTLEATVIGVWEALSAHRVAPCLVCGGRMAPRYGAASKPLGGRCSDCGSTFG